MESAPTASVVAVERRSVGCVCVCEMLRPFGVNAHSGVIGW